MPETDVSGCLLLPPCPPLSQRTQAWEAWSPPEDHRGRSEPRGDPLAQCGAGGSTVCLEVVQRVYEREAGGSA